MSKIIRKKEFDIFARWLAISPLLRLLNKDQIQKIGIDDPEELWLLRIKSQAEFAKTFNLCQDTLTDWKEKEELWELVDKYKKQWGKRKTSSILAEFYRKTISECDAARVKLWLQYFENWIPEENIKFKSEIKIEKYVILEKKLNMILELNQLIENGEKEENNKNYDEIKTKDEIKEKENETNE